MYLKRKTISQFDLINQFESVGIQLLKNMNSKNSETLAIPFISFHENQGFRLSPQSQQFLSSLPEGRQLGIVSIVGKYRTGKSFFVNRVLLDQKKSGFQVGPTINPCTKGLWLWKKTIPSQTNKNMDLILIDTEGFGGMDENANHDSRIFLFSLLLSSYFIYNSVGSIDQNAINTLNLIINLAKDIQTKTNNSIDDQSQFPSFLWIVRDFTLKLVDKNETPITPKQYLENALEFQKGSNDATQNKNKIRRLLKHFFQDRDCQTMVRPTQAQKDLQKLDQIDNSLLRPQFVNQVKAIRSKVYSRVKPKKVNGQSLNGQLLVSLCKGYMQSINKGHLPNVESAWFYVCRNQGTKAVIQASKVLQLQIDQLMQNPVKPEDIEKQKQKIRQRVMQQFKKRALNSQQGHPDLVQKLQLRMDEYFSEFEKKNNKKWTQIYKQRAQEMLQRLRQKLYNQEYCSFNQFVIDLQKLKTEYDQQTNSSEGSVQKWHHFNQISQNLYRLAGETITEKVNNNLMFEKQLLEQKLSLQEEELKDKEKGMKQEKEKNRQYITELERQVARLKAIEQNANQRVQQYKAEYESIYSKFRVLQTQNEQFTVENERLKRQNRARNQNETQQAKSELYLIKTTMQKERSLFEMEKQFLQEEVDRYKERCNTLESQNRKIRQANTKLSTDFEQLESRHQQKCQQVELLQQTNNNYSKKIEKLLIENSKKNELVGDYNEWLLEKSYLENQVAFLKNTMNENKKLHDALLVAFQKSINCNEEESSEELTQANTNLSSALEKMQEKYRVLEEKYNRLKDIKKVLKNCNSLECSFCCKSISTTSFAQHVEQCSQEDQQSENISERTKTLSESNKQNLHITVSQNVVKESQDRKKPYTQYIVQIIKGSENNKWKVNKRYKEFTELQQLLINKFPYIKYPPSCNFLSDINTLVNNRKNMMAEQRRKSLQQYLRDLCKIQEIKQCNIFKDFLQIKDSNSNKDPQGMKKTTFSKAGSMLQESNVKKRGLFN